MATYTAQFRTLAYKTDQEDLALKAYFYKGLNRRVKEAIVVIKEPDSLAELIELVIRINTRQYEIYINKQALSKTGPAKRQPRGDLIELDTTETKGSRTKAYYLYGKTGHLKRNYLTKEATEVTEHQFKVTEESPEGKAREYITESWTACYKDNCLIHLSDKEGLGWYPTEPRRAKKTKRPIVEFKLYDTEEPLTIALKVEIEGYQTIALVNREKENKIIKGLYDQIRGYI